MSNFTGEPAFYANPKTVLEVMQKLKASVPEADREVLLEAIGGLTQRDLLFYNLGRVVGHESAVTTVKAAFAPLKVQEEQVRAILKKREGNSHD
jgi:hypothetical protein